MLSKKENTQKNKKNKKGEKNKKKKKNFTSSNKDALWLSGLLS